MMRKPLACPKCGKTEGPQPDGVAFTSGAIIPIIGGLDPHNCPGCWDTIRASPFALPHVDRKPIPRPTREQQQAVAV